MSERAYAALLRLYPAGHPRDEMLGVLLEADRPMWREVGPLVLGGLRARSGGDQSIAVKWLYAARAAALMLLVVSALIPVRDVATGWLTLTAAQVLVWIAAGLAVVAVVAGLRVPAAALALITFVLSASAGGDWRAVVGYSLAAALLVIPGPRTPVHSPLPLLLALAAMSGDPVVTSPFLTLAVVVLVWTVVDERLALAVGLALCTVLVQAVPELPGDARGLLIVAAWRLGPVVFFLALGTALAIRRARV